MLCVQEQLSEAQAAAAEASQSQHDSSGRRLHQQLPGSASPQSLRRGSERLHAVGRSQLEPQLQAQVILEGLIGSTASSSTHCSKTVVIILEQLHAGK